MSAQLTPETDLPLQIQTSQEAIVQSVSKKTRETILHFENGEDIHLPAYLYINDGDHIIINRSDGNLVSAHKRVLAEVNEESLVKLFPKYDVSETIVLPPHEITIRFRERYREKDLDDVKLLEQFHYRGNGFDKIVGRRTILLAEAEGIGVIGYGVISATVLAARPRFELFEMNLQEQMRSRLINKIARIPRIVVHPEYRGLGIGSRLAKHLVQYALEHWDIKGYKPVMIEVIASMTQYHKFFEVAGFVHVGLTAGKATIFKPNYGRNGWEARPNSTNYRFFGPLGPKPYLVYSLCKEVQERVTKKISIEQSAIKASDCPPLLSQPIIFKKVSVNYLARNRRTKRTEEVRTVFGVDSGQMSSPVLHNFSLTIEPGDVVLATGASGSGKSTFLKLLTHSLSKLSKVLEIDGTLSLPKSREIAVLGSNWKDRLPLVDQVGTTLEESIALLNSVGLAEAHLYLKNPNQISEGQRYRFSIAHLCNSMKPVWVADEFASTLDPYTAAVVAKGIRKQATKVGATLILAAPHIDHFAPTLAPTQLVRLQWGGLAQIHAMKLMSQRTDDSLRLSVLNRTRSKLTDVRLTLSDTEGQVNEIIYTPQINGMKVGAEIELPFSSFRKGSSVRASSAEGAGDVVYLN
jgi:ABC-type lipoprotein export system ATPase subunit/GNAT superfamily N-acetyltransferase